MAGETMKNVGEIQLKNNDEYFRLLANEVVVLAIQDWKSLVGGEAVGSGSVKFDSLREFFLSDWCDFLLQGTGVTGEFILRKMEEYRLEYEEDRKGKENAKRRN